MMLGFHDIYIYMYIYIYISVLWAWTKNTLVGLILAYLLGPLMDFGEWEL